MKTSNNQGGEARFYESLGPYSEAFQGGLPAILYHQIDWMRRGVLRRGLILSPSLLRRQIHDLHKAGFRSVPTARIHETSGTRAVLVTFDDGFLNVLEHAVPVLAEFGFCAIQFLVPRLLGKSNVWDAAAGERAARLMDAAEVREWIAAGHSIGSHTMTHPRLTHVSRAQAREEISASKKALEDEFQLPISDFAYPFGDYDPTVREFVLEAGYDRAWTTEGGVNSPEADRFSLRRYIALCSLRKPWNLLRSLHPLAFLLR